MASTAPVGVPEGIPGALPPAGAAAGGVGGAAAAGSGSAVPAGADDAAGGGTGDVGVDAAVERLAALAARPVAEHVEEYEAVHRALQDALATLDQG